MLSFSLVFQGSFRRLSTCGMAVLLAGSSLLALQADAQAQSQAQDQTRQTSGLTNAASRNYAIPPGPLAQALNRFADESGLQLIYDASITANIATAGVSGSHSPADALQALLKNSGLGFRVTGSNAITLYRLPPDQIKAGSEATALPAISVLGTAQSRYESRHAETGSRFDKDVIDIGRSVDIIPEQLLLDQQARELEDIYRMSPNVVNMDGFGGTREDYLIRGFRRRDDTYRNGVRIKSNSRIDPGTVDNVQIIKGPVADIGQMSPGGLVNIITKKPEFEDKGSAELNFDEYGQRRAMGDITGALDTEKTLAYRITTSAEDTDTFRKLDVKRQFLSSSLLWEPESGASVKFNYEFSNDERPLDRGFVTAVSNGQRSIVNASPSTRFDQPNLNKRDATYHLAEADFSVPLGNSAWTLENKLFFLQEKTDDIRVEVTAVSAAGVLTRQVQGNRDRVLTTRFGRLQAKGEFDYVLPTKLATGMEYHEQIERWTNFSGATQVGGTVGNPGSFTVVDNSGTPNSLSDAHVQQRSFGPFVQTDISLTDQLTLTLGARYEFYDGAFRQRNNISGAVTDGDPAIEGKFTKAADLVWKPEKSLALYLSYADTFQSQNIYGGNNTVVILAPEQGRQYETGVKWSGLDGKLFLGASLFDIEQDNVVETVNGQPVLTGGIRSRGVELSAIANLYKGFNLRGSLGRLGSEVVSTGGNNGNRPTNTPATTAALWVSYEFQEAGSPLQGLGIGAGASYVGNRYGDTAHTFELGSYTLFDAGIWYYLPINQKLRARFDLGVKNITDEEYFVASGGNFRIAVGSPRTVFTGVRLEF